MNSIFRRLVILLVLSWKKCSPAIPGEQVSYRNLNQNSTHYSDFYSTKNFIKQNHYTESLALEGQTLFDEIVFQKSLSHFNRERIPERVVHAKGFTSYGIFKVTNPQIKKFTKAMVFSEINKETRVAVRFSTQIGERGSADTVLGEPRGFGVKFYTEQGIYDLLCINTPVFFINDPQMFVHMIHALKRDPRTDLRNSDNQWDFFSLRTETLNSLLFVYSDYGLPNGYRHMPGFSVNTFSLVNENNEKFYTRFMFVPNSGVKNLNLSQIFWLAGKDPDYASRDLFDSIENQQFPSWTLYIQVVTTKEADTSFTYNPFDSTKLWPFDRFTPIEVGVLTLTKNIGNAFAENEQLALNPGNLVPGIEPSFDRLLRGRLFAYHDAQVYRLGANHQLLIPVNQQLTKAFNERDASLRTDSNLGSLPNYYPNSVFLEKPWLYDFVHTPLFSIKLNEIAWLKSDSFEQHYRHAAETYRSFTTSQKNRLHSNLAHALSSITKKTILERTLKHFDAINFQLMRAVRIELEKINYNKFY